MRALALLIGRLAVSCAAVFSTFAIYAGWLRASQGAGLGVLLILAGLYFASPRPDFRFIRIAVLFTALVPAMVLGKSEWPLGFYWAVRSVALLCFVWSAVLPFWGVLSKRARAIPSDWPAASAVIAFSGLVGLSLFRQWPLSASYPTVIDENLYLFQAGYFFDDWRGLAIDSALEPFFGIRQTFVHAGFLNGQYPPGWPMILGFLQGLGLEGLEGVVVYAFSLIGVALLGRSCGMSWRFVTIAMVLTGGSAMFLIFGSTYFAHGISSALALFSGCAAVMASVKEGKVAIGLWLATGFLTAMVVATRPLTGLVCGGALAWWLFFLSSKSWERRLIGSIAIAAGGLLPVGFLMMYNARTVGHALRFGYDASHHGLQALGLGDRGGVIFDSNGMLVDRIVGFSLSDAIAMFPTYIGEGVMGIWPGGLLVILGTLYLHQRQRIDWWRVVPFFFLPVAYSFYFYRSFTVPGPRLLTELLPFAVLGSVGLAERIENRGEFQAGLLCWLTAGLTLASSFGYLLSQEPIANSSKAYFELVEEKVREHGPLLVFVSDRRIGDVGKGDGAEPALEALYWYNSRGSGEVVVGRDVPRIRQEVIARFPEHKPVRFVVGSAAEMGTWGPAEIIPLEP